MSDHGHEDVRTPEQKAAHEAVEAEDAAIDADIEAAIAKLLAGEELSPLETLLATREADHLLYSAWRGR